MSEITKTRIIDAAGEVFAEKGFAQATIREICKLADVNLAAINYHFGDKQKLYIEAVKSAHCEGEEDEPLLIPAEVPAEKKLYYFIEHMMTDMLDRESPTWHVELMMREMARPTLACSELVQSYIGPKFSILMSIIEEMVPATISLSKKHLLAFSVVGQCLLYRFHRPIGKLLIGDEEFESLFDVSYLADHICEFSLQGIQSISDSQEASS